MALLGLALSLAACSTAANRRELYNTIGENGPWHDYSRRLDAATATGVAPGDMGHAADASLPTPEAPTGPTTIRNGRPTRQPKSSPALPAPATVPSPTGVPVSPTITDPGAPAAPGSATTAPPADATVPVNPPTT